MKLTSSELVRKIAQNTRQEESTVKIILDAMAFSIKDTLQEEGSKAYMKNIGHFELMRRKQRKIKLNGRTYSSNSEMYIKFSPSKKFKNGYNIYEK